MNHASLQVKREVQAPRSAGLLRGPPAAATARKRDFPNPYLELVGRRFCLPRRWASGFSGGTQAAQAARQVFQPDILPPCSEFRTGIDGSNE